MAILTISEALNLGFRKFQHIRIANISQNEEIMASKMVKMAIFSTLDLPKLISQKICVAAKFSNFHTVSVN